ncbi:DUF5302 domain-containing protein [Kitasatospora sp. NPDC059571]|uniref:DUF5302 domain-containing protein n=1 Tax=Kitasatospora sp. NPDC059571 TaxID=3346871 RepID=UPI0036A45883
MTQESAPPADQEPAEQSAAEAAPAAGDDVKAKFLAALQAKHGGPAGRAGAGGDSKIHGTHGAAGGKRTFRRKSGG